LYSTWRNLDFRGFFLFPSSLSTPKVAFTVNISKIEKYSFFFVVSYLAIDFNCPLVILLLLRPYLSTHPNHIKRISRRIINVI
jgi:hypothetical protein